MPLHRGEEAAADLRIILRAVVGVVATEEEAVVGDAQKTILIMITDEIKGQGIMPIPANEGLLQGAAEGVIIRVITTDPVHPHPGIRWNRCDVLATVSKSLQWR